MLAVQYVGKNTQKTDMVDLVGGLLVHRSSGGLPGQPVFHGGGIGTFSKVSGPSYSDSYFDIWVHFDESVYGVSGDYRGN